jgi:hypothetical protein
VCRRPELGTLYQVVADNYRTLEAAAEQGWVVALPGFVKEEFERYLDCGLLCRGFGVLHCESPGCGEKLLVPFACKGRGWCPSCSGRRMAQSAANLVDHVLPSRTPLRQFVLTLPFELRARLAYDGQLLGEVTRLFVGSVLGFYRRTMRDLHRIDGGQSGAVTALQRVSSDLRLNPHMHSVVLDGVFSEDESGDLVFHRLPSLDNSEVLDLLQTVRARVLALLERRGVIESRLEPRLIDDGFAEREPAVAALASAAVTGHPPAGPEHRERPALALRPSTERSVSGLCARDGGFSLHAATTAPADDARARESLCKYILRPPLAEERLEQLDNGLVRIRLKRQFSDGTVAIDLDPLSLLCRLAAAVPPPRLHVVRYAGVLSAAHLWRSRVTPPPTLEEAPRDGGHARAHAAPTEDDVRPPTHRSTYRPWAELLKRTFDIDLACPTCGARMKLRALVTRAKSITRFLRRIGEPTEPTPIAPARGPPFYKSPVLRRKLGQLDGDSHAQIEMFEP